MSGKTLKPDLRVPEQKTASLSFCDTAPKAFRAWVKQLPMANTGETSRQLYHAIIELNQLFVAPKQRLRFLELVREEIHFVCRELSKHYLGLAAALPEKQRKIANLAQALQLHLANGYKLCILNALELGGADKNRKLIAKSLHRATSELSSTILRSYQLYCPAPANSWLECHRMFRFACNNKLSGAAIADSTREHNQISTLADNYKRLLLLGCARPNQLRQSELTQAYSLFANWAEYTLCGSADDENSLFIINPERDGAPVYRSLLKHPAGNDNLGFETRELATRVSDSLEARHRRQTAPNALEIPASVSDTLLSHLSQALGTMAERNHNRVAREGTLEICVGLTATHYFVAGGKSFTEFVTGHESNPEEDENLFVRASRKREDAWAGAHDAAPSGEHLYAADTPINYRGGFGNTSASVNDKNRPRSHSASLVNTSPGGYCVSWEAGVPPAMEAGEILGVRENPSLPWSVAVVRWIRQARNRGTRIGIELLAPNVSPCGIRLLQSSGNNSEYLRGLLLPGSDASHQPVTVITPRLPFRLGSRVSVLHDGLEEQGQLTHLSLSTGSISQFELKLQTPKAPASSGTHRSPLAETSDEDFDSLWPSL